MLRIVIVLSLVFASSLASAGTCPKRPVAEHGGTHWCYDAGRRGHIHLWKPGAYDAAKAVTVVYLHGYNVGTEGCPNAHYLDCAWERHGLARQFDASGLNALFVAVEGPVNDGQKAKWTSLDAVLDSVLHKGGIRPRGSVTLMAHSGGVFTAFYLMKDDRVAHLVYLDAIYLDASTRAAKWLKASRGHRLTLVGAESCHRGTESLAEKLGCQESDDLALPLSGDQKSARCAAVVDGTVGHMDVITDGHVIPMVLTRTVTPKPKPRPAKKPLRRKRHH